ncbi:MAG: hypothetical protein ACR2IE_01185 [Candidatus Sumerlaeaceae bacterium]
MLKLPLKRFPLLLVCSLSTLAAQSQTAATPSPTTAAAEPEKVQTREERIKQHHERIEKIIQENRKKTEDQQKAAAASMAAATGGTTASASAPAGGPLPTGPIQPATMAPPIQQAQKQPQSQSPQAARSESRTILMFDPMDSVVNIGDTFATNVIAETKTGTVDSVSILLRYSKQLLNPLALDHRAIDPLVDGEVQYSFDPDAGEIYFTAPLKEPTRFALTPLIKIVWEALEATDGTTIGFGFDPQRPSGLFFKNNNLLGTVPNANDGVIKATVMVRSPKAKTMVSKVGESGLIISSRESQPAPPIMQLQLEPSVIAVMEGEEFKVKVILQNQSGAPLDRLRILARFNPEELEVVDADRGNRIRSGVNIEEGFASEKFPFDFAKYNRADNAAGLITYDVASEITPVRGNGTFAVIRFRAKRTTGHTEISLLKGADSTDVSYLHQTMLAPSMKHGNVLASVGVRVDRDPDASKRTSVAAKRTETSPFRSRLGTTFHTD